MEVIDPQWKMVFEKGKALGETLHTGLFKSVLVSVLSYVCVKIPRRLNKFAQLYATCWRQSYSEQLVHSYN